MASNIWLNATPEEVDLLRRALADRDDPLASSLLEKIELLTENRDHDEAFRAAVVEKYTGKLTDGDLDFQHDGMVSQGDDGAYVMAFLWVSNEEAMLEPMREARDDALDGPF